MRIESIADSSGLACETIYLDARMHAGGMGANSAAVFAAELVHATSSIHDFLLAGVEGVAG